MMDTELAAEERYLLAKTNEVVARDEQTTEEAHIQRLWDRIGLFEPDAPESRAIWLTGFLLMLTLRSALCTAWPDGSQPWSVWPGVNDPECGLWGAHGGGNGSPSSRYCPRMR